MSPAYSGLRQGRPNPIVCGRKFCPKCGRWRLIVYFRMQRTVGRPERLRPWCETCDRIGNRQTKANRTEKQLELAREYQRFWTEVKRRQAGIPPRQMEKKPLPIERIFLEPAPLLRAMGFWADAQSDPSWKALARRAGLQPRAIWRLQHGESKHVRIDVADKLAVAIGVPLSVIYPDERST